MPHPTGQDDSDLVRAGGLPQPSNNAGRGSWLSRHGRALVSSQTSDQINTPAATCNNLSAGKHKRQSLFIFLPVKHLSWKLQDCAHTDEQDISCINIEFVVCYNKTFNWSKNKRQTETSLLHSSHHTLTIFCFLFCYFELWVMNVYWNYLLPDFILY